ncbi:cytochrome P450 4C1-like [Periplaneta americana]|uniref:cytochrome P450 4C1-like n=1 Tax=Periplaneta americana TaxID=6978 RepID=UPI0037E7CB7D
METGLIFLYLIFALIIGKLLWSKRRELFLMSKLPGPSLFSLMKLYLVGVSSNNCDIFRLLNAQFDKYGSLVATWILLQPLVMTSNAEHIRKIVKHDPLCHRYPNRLTRKVFEPAFRTGLLAIDGEQWKKHRKTLNTEFHTNFVVSFVNVFSKNAEILSNRLHQLADGSFQDIQNYFLQCTGDTLFETSCSFNSEFQKNDEKLFFEYLNFILDTQVKRIRKPWLLADFIFKRSEIGRKHEVAINNAHNIIKKVIYERRVFYDKMFTAGVDVESYLRQNGRLIDSLLRNPEFNTDDIIGELASAIAAGTETTATACCSALSLFCEHQDIQEKVVDEQKSVFGEDFLRPVTNEDLLHMTYLDQVIKETLRLFSPASIMFRTTVDEVDLGNGQIIPTGTLIFILASAIHWNPDYYPDPYRFDPDRFSPENTIGRHPYAYLPFGIGRRKCVGYYYAILEMKTILSTVVRRCRFLEVEGGVNGLRESLQVGIGTIPKIGFAFKFVPREN